MAKKVKSVKKPKFTHNLTGEEIVKKALSTPLPKKKKAV